MTVGSFKSYYTGWCDVCKSEWGVDATITFVPGKRGYFCSEKCAYQAYPEAQAKPAETPTTEAARQSSIAQAHKENLESARMMRDCICLLTAAVNGLEKELSVLVTVLREGKA